MEKQNKALQQKIKEVHQLLQTQKVSKAAALLQELHEQRPADAKVLLLLGIAALKQHEQENALQYLQQAIKEDKSLSEAHFYLASLYLLQEQYDKAIEEYQKVSNLDHSYFFAQMNLSQAFENKWRYREAQVIYEKLLINHQEELQIYLNLGKVLEIVGKPKEAIALYEKGLLVAPNSLEILMQLGEALHQNAQYKSAKKYFHKALAINPHHVKALYYLSQHHTFKDESSFPETKAIQEILHNQDVTIQDKTLCHYALGRIYDVSEYHERAFYHYEQANNLSGAQNAFDEKYMQDKIQDIKSVFTTELIQKKRILPFAECKPLFIVGMAGSGKHLIAKALANHPDIALAPYQEYLSDIAFKLQTNKMGLASQSNEDLIKCASDYGDNLKSIALKPAPLIIDVMPDNYLYLGLINILFPDSTIIHCTRHPMDLCLANYFRFHGKQNAYAHHLVSLGHYYQHYAKLMSYWQSIGIENRIEIKYEDLIEEPKQTLEKLFAGLSLTLSKDYPFPHYYPYEIERWKKYQHYLKPLVDVLYDA